jgi:UDP-N-acetyl-D-mannosaminuronate dehydrogenase
VAGQTKSLVVGLGEVGRPLLEVLARVHPVEGIDLPPRPVQGPIEMLHVCYPGEVPDFVGVTARYAEQFKPQIIIIHSTVPLGTSRAVQQRVAVPVVNSPVRGKHVKMAQELTHYVKFVGTADAAAGERVERYLRAAGMRTQRLPSSEATELAKLTETTYFGLLIAFAQDVDRMARQAGVTYEDVVSFYDEIGYLPRVRFFPGVIGGHCVMPNIKLLKQTFSSRLLDAIEWSNETRRKQET